MINSSIVNRVASSWVWPIAAGVGGYFAGQELARHQVNPTLVAGIGFAVGGPMVMGIIPTVAGSQLSPKLRWFVKADEAVARGIRPGAIGLSTWIMCAGAAAAVGAMAGALTITPKNQ